MTRDQTRGKSGKNAIQDKRKDNQRSEPDSRETKYIAFKTLRYALLVDGVNTSEKKASLGKPHCVVKSW